MKVNLLTDAPLHNLALMKISAYHKAQGDSVVLNRPLSGADFTYCIFLLRVRAEQATVPGGGGLNAVIG